MADSPYKTDHAEVEDLGDAFVVTSASGAQLGEFAYEARGYLTMETVRTVQLGRAMSMVDGAGVTAQLAEPEEAPEEDEPEEDEPETDADEPEGDE